MIGMWRLPKDTLIGTSIPSSSSYIDRHRKANELKGMSTVSLPELDKELYLADWRLPDSLGIVAKLLKLDGALFLFSGPVWSNSQVHTNKHTLHTSVVLYKDHTLVLANPAYEWKEPELVNGVPQMLRTTALNYGTSPATAFFRIVRKRYNIEKCYYAKASRTIHYNDLNCNEMSQDFILDFMENGRDVDVVWEKARFVELRP